MADAERAEVVGYRRGIVEGEALVELQPVSRTGHPFHESMNLPLSIAQSF